MDIEFNINNDDLVALTNKLEKTHKSAMPVAVRQTLNDAAFNAKTKQVEKTFAKQFTIRKKGFIKSHTHVNKSDNTFDIRKMEAEMGVIEGKSSAGDELQYQELGGTIKSRDYIPLPGPGHSGGARVSGSHSKKVSKRFYLNKIEPEQNKPIYKQQKFIRKAIMVGEGGYLIFGEILLQVRKIKKPSNDRIFIDTKPLYHYEENRNVNLKPSPFLAPAAKKASEMIPEMFKKRAEERFQKYMNK